MKTHNGFISNSSSSSFIILKKDKTLSAEELKKRSVKCYEEYFDCDIANDEYYQKEIADLVKNNQYVLLMQNIENGAEDGVEKLIKNFADKLNITDITFKWTE